MDLCLYSIITSISDYFFVKCVVYWSDKKNKKILGSILVLREHQPLRHKNEFVKILTKTINR